MLMPFFSLSAESLPLYSLDFERGSSQYLSMSDANFGAYDKAKWAISVWVKFETSANSVICSHGDNGTGQRAFDIRLNGTSKIDITTSSDGSTANGRLVTTDSFSSTADWYHILIWYDSANATAGDRMRLWVNGVEVTSFTTDTNPSAAVFNSTEAVRIGANASVTTFFDGLIYQFAFFSGVLPTISQVYNAGAPKDLSTISGLYAALNATGNSVVADDVLSADWTNNNTVITSTTKP